jgi:hypothetical protein
LGPKECLLPTFTSTEDNYLQLKKVIEKSGILVTERPKGRAYLNKKTTNTFYSLADFSSKDIKQDLCRLLVKGKDEDTDKFEMKVGVMRMFSFSLILLLLMRPFLLAEMQMEHAKCALSAAIKFLQVMKNKEFIIIFFDFYLF